MKLTPQDIKSTDKIGDTHNGGEVFHIQTKGGLNLIVKKSKGGEYSVLGSGPHRSYALHQAEAVEKNITWINNLFKSEDMQLKKAVEGKPDSNPQTHYDLASHHSKMAGKYHSRVDGLKQAEHIASSEREHMKNDLMHSGAKDFTQLPPEVQAKWQMANKKSQDTSSASHDANMRTLYHTDAALKHYQMSGMDHKQSLNEHKKHMSLHHEIPDDAKPPVQDQYGLELSWNLKNRDKSPPKGLGYNWSE